MTLPTQQDPAGERSSDTRWHVSPCCRPLPVLTQASRANRKWQEVAGFTGGVAQRRDGGGGGGGERVGWGDGWLTSSRGRKRSSCRATTTLTLSPCRVLRSMATSSSWLRPVMSTPFTCRRREKTLQSHFCSPVSP